MVSLVKDKLNQDSIEQYKIEERSILAKRIISSGARLNNLVTIMQEDLVSHPENHEKLSTEIFKFTKDEAFQKSRNMGDLMRASFDYVLRHYENQNMTNLIRS